MLKWDLFRLCPPPAYWANIICTPPDARAIFLHNGLLSDDTCSVTGGGGRIIHWGGTNGKDPKNVYSIAK